MHNDLTPTGIPAVGPVSWGSHFCQLYDGPEDMADTLVPFFKAGLERNEVCHWVTSEHFGVDAARSALRAAYPGLDQAERSGQITIMSRGEWYQRNPAFVAEEIVDGWLQHEEGARSSGYAGYRLTGDTLWLEPHQWDEFSRYESLVNEAFGSRRIIGLCTYCMGKCGAAEVLDLVNTHAFALARRRGQWEVVESPSIKLAKAELSLLNENLSERVEEATRELRTLLSNKEALLREVHHRVKNNLQIVANLLAMKSRGATEEARQALAETADRVHAISAVHEALYADIHAGGVLLGDRLRVIADRLAATYGLGDRVSVSVSGDNLQLSLTESVPVALLATELASNSFKHAFPTGKTGRIDVGIRALSGGGFELSVTDDGIGLMPTPSRRGSGLDIARALARQVGGSLSVENRPDGGVRAVCIAALH